MDKRYWLCRDESGDVGFSMYPTTREEFERQCAHIEGQPVITGRVVGNVQVSEISFDDFTSRLANLTASCPWVAAILELRKEAKRKIFRTLKGVKYTDIPYGEAAGWRIRLSVDGGDGPLMFHLSARRVGGEDASLDDMTLLAQMIYAMGGVPLPQLLAKNEAYHFRWPAVDVGPESLN